MARGTRACRRFAFRQHRSTPYPLPSRSQECPEKEASKKKSPKAVENKDWEDAMCSVCMEFPHNAVLLLCSSYDKGCRPYMCDTSFRHSNCLNQFKKAYTKDMSPRHGQGPVQDSLWNGSADHHPTFSSNEKQGVMELACPLCRGQVKGWTVVEAAREYLNAKKRSCMQDDCSFVGTYKELRKHMRVEHPSAQPREVDPMLEQKWKRLEREREREDVISTIRSSMPGAMVLGDYVIESGHHRHGFDTDDEDEEIDEDGNYGAGIEEPNWLNVLFLLQAFGQSGNVNLTSRLRRLHQRGFRMSEGSSSGNAPPFAAARTAVSISSDGEDDSSTIRGRGVSVGRSERRRRRQRRGQRDR
ncbi:uncharacterized protein LOC131236468 [Magnolia sinica]|uniref:uncharacterized protein LOC131236468 n=1 Tax=Magnolia sinica TaxID=86752 RepID=UPI00265B587A|nr:uncharacterized protein LOC131236468 [Magnolia sinica]XP_058089650.1 uncharacterized protein LOC131236468 [Magnolia sinica]XP_058089652.1 uncharacterized protein LOC131236468 [Magnolia sinica]XP_058089653.1 uncharacterized protein LOC131236468 [Magnolia sinica]XP_058089654.1 uncharacterized protein LOC131236468 [Magnolia sinica]XP_058089655.1 uncharacterized protein LOC131236468 [Magnolia sinica]